MIKHKKYNEFRNCTPGAMLLLSQIGKKTCFYGFSTSDFLNNVLLEITFDIHHISTFFFQYEFLCGFLNCICV